MILDNYIIKMTDPIIDPTQANDATQTQGVFGGSDDVFNNPDLVKPVKQEETTPENTTNVDDFDIHLDDLKISQHVEKEAPVEEKKPEIIEPQIEIETTPEAPKPEIIEQEAETKKIPQAAPHPHPTRTTVVEPQMTTGAKVNP
jgi:hypothetical protein